MAGKVVLKIEGPLISTCQRLDIGWVDPVTLPTYTNDRQVAGEVWHAQDDHRSVFKQIHSNFVAFF